VVNDQPQHRDIKVSLAGERDTKTWDEYVGAHPDSFFCQTTAWREVVESAYGHRPYYLMAWEGTTLRGVLPLFLIQSRLFGRMLASGPFSSAGAICADDDAASTALVEQAIEISRERRVEYLELKSVRSTPCQSLVRYTDYLNYWLRLSTLDTLWKSSLDKDTRAAIRQAERFGLTTEQGQHCVDDFYGIVANNMRRLGTPVHSRQFYDLTLATFGERANIVLVKHGPKAIAGALLLRHVNQVSVLHTGSLSGFLRFRPNNLLYWEIIKQAVAWGASTIDMGRSLAGSGTSKFKESWGAVGQPLCYEYFLNRRKTLPQINQANPRFAAARWIWQRMPMPLTKWLGPVLISSIP
jgi:FemAB-related protein (PEP-CTERM system-associated)